LTQNREGYEKASFFALFGRGSKSKVIEGESMLTKKVGVATIITGSVLAIALIGCGSKNSSSNYDTTSAEVAGAAFANAGNSTDDSGGSTVSFFKKPLTLPEKIQSYASQILESKAAAATCGSSASTRIYQNTTNCTTSSGVINLSLASCTGLVGSYSGTEVFTFGSVAACTSAETGGLISMTNGQSVAVTAPGDVSLATFNGYTVETDSNSSGYATPENGGISVSCGTGGCGTTRTVTISGVHRQLTGPLGTTLYNHTYSTTTPLTITGTMANGNRTIQSGTIVLQHNIALYTATTQVTTPIGFTAGCCVPTSGSATTTFASGTKTGSETVTFTSTCGVASVNGHSVALTFCQ
jgi:hypothetical protein